MKKISLNIVVLLLLISPIEMAFGQQNAKKWQAEKNTDPISKKELNIYPNPVQDVFQVSNSNAVKTISINNIAGKEVKRFTIRSGEFYSIADLRKGVYIVRLFDYRDEPVKVVRLNKV